MTLDMIVSGLQYAVSQGAHGNTVVLVKLADGTLHQISNLDLVPMVASLAPSQVPANPTIVVATLA